MWNKIDKTYVGVIIGILLPLVLFMILYPPAKLAQMDGVFVLSRRDGEAIEFLPAALPLMLTQIIFPNAILFFLAIWNNRLKIAKGLLITTAILTALMVILELAY